jgi:AP-3 complex subunit beta
MLGSMTLTVGREMAGHAGLTGYQDLPEWVVEGEEPDARLRDVEGGDGVAGLEMGKGRLTAARMLDEALRKEAKGAAAAMVGAGRTGTASAAAAAAAGKEKSLDAWLDESDGEEEDGETGSESETETETESGSGSDADEDEDEDEGNDDDNRETSERKSDEELLPPTE